MYFNPTIKYKIPSAAFCNGLPNNPGKDCFLPPANSMFLRSFLFVRVLSIITGTTVQFFFGSDPPDFNPPTPTPSPTPRPIPQDDNGIPVPPGGFAVGGGIGAAVLVGILGIIGGLMLLMKKQDSR